MTTEGQELFLVCADLAEQTAIETRKLGLDKASARHQLAMTLLIASIDQGRGLTHLLAADPTRYGAPAMALFRPQLEQFLRGAVFTDPKYISDSEVDEFLKKDKMPNRTIDGATVPIPISLMASHAAELVTRGLNFPPDLVAKLPGMVKFASREIHGLVHGGLVILHVYKEEGGSPQFYWEKPGVRDFCVNSALLCVMAFLAAQRMAGLPGTSPVSPTYADAFNRFVATAGSS